jgi:hypothetical protein
MVMKFDIQGLLKKIILYLGIAIKSVMADDTEIRIERMLTRGLISFEQAQLEKEKYFKLYPRRAQKAKRGIASLNSDSFAIPTIQETQKVLLNSKN